MVQKRYDSLRENYMESLSKKDPFEQIPEKDNDDFVSIGMLWRRNIDMEKVLKSDKELIYYIRYDAGHMVYGNNNPDSEIYNSLADYYFGDEYHQLYDLLLSYLEDSSVYCRENVLKALYASGNVQALYNMLSRMEEYRIFHHRKLITDGLITFKGDKKALAEILWSHMDMFGENMKVAIINFITATQEDYGEEFMKALQKKHQNIEVTLSLIRYYRRHYYEPILPLLYDYMNRDVDNSISIVVASVLTKYPMEETREVLKNSIHHTNWYVRLNSATSLVEMNISDEDINSIIDSGDAYAMEILHYVLEENSEEGRINA